LVKLQAIDVGDEHAVTKELMARLDRARAKLATYDRLLADMLDGRDDKTFQRDAERIGPYLTLMGGRMYEQTNIRWCTAALEVLSSVLRSGTSR
jgi:Virulence activator alpha C-term